MLLSQELTSVDFRHFKTCAFRVLSIVKWLCRSRWTPEVLSDFKRSHLTATSSITGCRLTFDVQYSSSPVIKNVFGAKHVRNFFTHIFPIALSANAQQVCFLFVQIFLLKVIRFPTPVVKSQHHTVQLAFCLLVKICLLLFLALDPENSHG